MTSAAKMFRLLLIISLSVVVVVVMSAGKNDKLKDEMQAVLDSNLQGDQLCDFVATKYLPSIRQKFDLYYFFRERKVWLMNGLLFGFEVNLDDRSKTRFISPNFLRHFECFPEYAAVLPASPKVAPNSYLYYLGYLDLCDRYFTTTFAELSEGEVKYGDCLREPFNRTGRAPFMKLFPGYITTTTLDNFWIVFIANDAATRHMLKFVPMRLVYTGGAKLKVPNGWKDATMCEEWTNGPSSSTEAPERAENETVFPPIGLEYALVGKQVFYLFLDAEAMLLMSATFDMDIPVNFQVVTGRLNYYYHGWVDDRNGKLYFVNDTIEVLEVDVDVLHTPLQAFTFTRTPLETFMLDCEPRPPPPPPSKPVPLSVWIALAIIAFGLIVGGGFIYYEYSKPNAAHETNWMTAEVSEVQSPKSCQKANVAKHRKKKKNQA